MASTANTKTELLHSGRPFRLAGLRNLSFSSSSSSRSCNSSFGSLSFNEDFNSFSPITPLRFSSGVPFSWEKIPGIPKQESIKNKESLRNLLPLPPARKTSNSSKKYVHGQIFPKKKDPFFAAFVVCSKDDDDDHDAFGSLRKGLKATRALNSCKRSCAVSDSLVYIPVPRSSSDYLLNRRSK
ncbi:unnamed protein product [Fraxinus pennsylvanica]|uniref:Uncharacterized protein n=1 Tax=Fraxinus pennsylvanica TaxID=56036 RepID=A0AAD2DK52_9LAMI|nr:unnamed protein product [Fraxinus pennsylvanica]